MQLDYGVDDQPPWWKNLLLGLQWSAILIPSIITLGRAVDASQNVQAPSDPSYLQRLFIVSAITLLVQVFRGHRLPVIAGPAAILLVAVLATGTESKAAIPTSIMCGGFLLIVLAWSGLLRLVRVLFTDRVIAVVLLLIAFTLLPTTLRLLIATESGISPRANLAFASALIIIMFLAQQLLTGIWQSTVIIWAMLIGTGAYFGLLPDAVTSVPSIRATTAFEALTTTHFTFEVQPSVLISFLLCFLAVSINDLSSIQSMNRLLNLQDMDRRVARGVIVTGLANVLSGLFGVVGPVNYSLSPGVVMTTGCASRFTLLPTAAILGILAFFPFAMQWVSMIPSVVIGCVLLYVLASQIAAGLSVAFPEGSSGSGSMQNGFVIGLPLLLGTMTAFLPDETLTSFPPMWRPLLGNGFVVGIVMALFLEHVHHFLPDNSRSR